MRVWVGVSNLSCNRAEFYFFIEIGLNFFTSYFVLNLFMLLLFWKVKLYSGKTSKSNIIRPLYIRKSINRIRKFRISFS